MLSAHVDRKAFATQAMAEACYKLWFAGGETAADAVNAIGRLTFGVEEFEGAMTGVVVDAGSAVPKGSAHCSSAAGS